MGRERRQSTRVAFTATATIRLKDTTYTDCATENLSTKGVFINGVPVSPQQEGERCDVELRLSGASSDLVLRMQGRVVRSQPEGVAVQFEEIDLDSFYHLKNIVYYNSDDPDAEARILPAIDEEASEADEFE